MIDLPSARNVQQSVFGLLQVMGWALLLERSATRACRRKMERYSFKMLDKENVVVLLMKAVAGLVEPKMEA